MQRAENFKLPETSHLRLDLIGWYNNIRFQRLEAMSNFVIHQSYLYCNNPIVLNELLNQAFDLKEVIGELHIRDLTILETHQLLEEIIETVRDVLEELSLLGFNNIKTLIEDSYLTDRFEHLQNDVVALMVGKARYEDSLQKYKIELLPGQYPAEVLFAELPFVNIQKFCFRGDSRGPATIFSFGLQPANPTTTVAFSPYLSRSSVVALTPRFAAASYFPIDIKVKTSYIYVVMATEIFNLDAASFTICDYTDWHVKKLGHGCMFAGELIAKSVSPENVLAAVEIVRSPWLDCPLTPKFPFYHHIGCYEIVSYQFNPHAMITPKEKDRLTTFIENEIASSAKPNKFPLPESGYTKQSFFQPTSKRWDGNVSSSLGSGLAASAASAALPLVGPQI